jgi:hypothetical protein
VSDRLIARIADVQQAREALIRELQVLGDAMEFNRSARREARPVSELFSAGPGPLARKRVRAAWSQLNESLHAYRTEAIRILVDQEGWSLAAAARLTGNARQVVSRLYHHAKSSGES